jgi:predicted ester cyclase
MGQEARMADLKALLERGNQQFNEHDAEGLLEYYRDDSEFEAPGGMNLRGADQIRSFLQGWFQGFPDCKVRVTNRIITGSTAVEEGVFSGTHTGVFPTPMGDIQPTGRSVEGKYIDVYEFDGEKVVRDHLIFDRLELLEQLGLLPVPAAAGASN